MSKLIDYKKRSHYRVGNIIKDISSSFKEKKIEQ